MVAESSNETILSRVLSRRFNDVMHYELPTVDEVRRIVENRTGAYDHTFVVSDTTAAELLRLCKAGIIRLCEGAMKRFLLTDPPLRDGLFQHFRACRQPDALSEDRERTANAVADRKGAYLEFKGPRNGDLVTKSLENISQGVRLLNVRQRDGITYAVRLVAGVISL